MVDEKVISNALKHHDKDSGTVEVRCSRRDHQLVFRVSDDGPGIPEDKREAAFQLFKRSPTRDRRTSPANPPSRSPPREGRNRRPRRRRQRRR